MRGLIVLGHPEQNHPRVHLIPLGALPENDAPARVVSARYLDLLAPYVLLVGEPGVTVIPLWPDSLPLSHRRMLKRTLLAAGGVALEVLGDPDAPLTPQTGLELPGDPWEGCVADLAQSRPNGYSNRGPGGGAFRTGVDLIVAGAPSTALNGALKHRLPFISFEGSGVSAPLAEALEEARIPEEDLYWVNAYDAASQPTDERFIEMLKPRRVVAIGSRATAWCNLREIPHVTVIDSSYWEKWEYETHPLTAALLEDRSRLS